MLEGGRDTVWIRKMGSGWFLTTVVSQAFPVCFKWES